MCVLYTPELLLYSMCYIPRVCANVSVYVCVVCRMRRMRTHDPRKMFNSTHDDVCSTMMTAAAAAADVSVRVCVRVAGGMLVVLAAATATAAATAAAGLLRLVWPGFRRRVR